MKLAAALIYWAIVALWLAVLTTVVVSYLRNPRTFGATRLLLFVVGIDTTRNIVENLYFGVYFGAQYGFFPGAIGAVLGNPTLLIIPKVLNVGAACLVLGLLLRRWLPAALQERMKSEEAIRRASDALRHEVEERQTLFETSLDLILITDRSGNFLRVSPSCTATLGYTPDEMTGRSGVEFVHQDDLEATRREMRLARSGREMRNFETRYIHKDGRIVTLAWSGVWCEPEQRHFFIGRDMTEQKRAEETLRHLAHYDQLTCLPNRVRLHEDLGARLAPRADAPPAPVAVALLDLDGFKDVNDTLGHSTGDRLLQEVAGRLVAATEGVAQVYRLGGDEFVVVAPNCGDPRPAAELVETLLGRLAERFDLHDHSLFVGASAGIAIAPSHGDTVDELIANADLALYDAKAAGRQTYRLFVPVLRAKAQARRKLDGELRRAFAAGELVLHFQPQFRLQDGAVIGAEALLRWEHPERGTLTPGAFIDALAESPIAVEVGRWILQASCRSAQRWRMLGLGPLRVGVNLFPAQFRDSGFVNDIEAALMDARLPPDALELEITENIALGRDDKVLEALGYLRDRGVQIAFDDFGTGYASLSYLTRYPLTRIKIDQSFVRKIGKESAPEDSAIVRSLIVMAHNLGLGIIAEGVETEDQAAFLRDNHCDEVQGFLYAKALPAEVFEEFLLASRKSASREWREPVKPRTVLR